MSEDTIPTIQWHYSPSNTPTYAPENSSCEIIRYPSDPAPLTGFRLFVDRVLCIGYGVGMLLGFGFAVGVLTGTLGPFVVAVLYLAGVR